ncbi:LysR family transcriptional regulator [Microbacterium sp. SORGH_AS_0888]|uniref:LysR family transcriptional regulator n=1 Tax=Microbacterium sp. SORGH_AS_0888 TaxID=3041791 RepID=UPI0027D84AB5|nr:LysR family transcriptional regulator [Microbacterium sp. SORGH_AS_0888]
MHTDVDLRLLASFLTVVTEGTVSAAAARLNLSQPAVSRQIRELERRLGVRLFDRTPTRLTLTAAARRVLPWARDVVERANVFAASVDRLANARSPYFRVACPEATVRGVIAPFVADTGTPIFHTSLSVASAVYEKVLRREVDFAVNTLPPPVTLASAPAATGFLSVFSSRDDPLTAGPAVGIDDLRGRSLILLTASSGLRRTIDHELWPIRDDIEVVAEPESSDLAIAIAAAGNGICVDLVGPTFGGRQRPLLRADGSRPFLQLYAAWEHDHFAAAEIAGIAQTMAQWDRDRHAADGLRDSSGG